MTKARKDLDLSLEEAAVRMGVSRSTLSSWEMERTSPGILEIEKVARVLSIAPSLLVFGKRAA